MRFLHSLSPPLIHRDLKSANVLVCLSGVRSFLVLILCVKLASCNPMDPVVAKVTDFGLSSELVLPAIKESSVTRAVMNPTWLAPEITKGDEYSEKSDVYSFGIIVNEVCLL